MQQQSRKAFAAHTAADASVLILGSMPGVASLQEHRYYAHPRNAFWPILCSYFSEIPGDYPSNLKLLVSNQVALWDVVRECIRPGSLDSAIQADSVVCNDFAAFLQMHNEVTHILFNGKTAEKLFRQHVLKTLGEEQSALKFHTMPSTSPAMATLTPEQKKLRWHAVLDDCLRPSDQALTCNL